MRKNNNLNKPTTLEEALLIIDNQSKIINKFAVYKSYITNRTEFIELISLSNFIKIMCSETESYKYQDLINWFKKSFYINEEEIPQEEHILSGLFSISGFPFQTPYGDRRSSTTFVTGKGQIYFTEMFKRILTINEILLN